MQNINLSIKQYKEITPLLNPDNSTEIRYWFNGKIVLVRKKQ